MGVFDDIAGFLVGSIGSRFSGDQSIGFGGNVSGTLPPTRKETRGFMPTVANSGQRNSIRQFQIAAPSFFWGFWHEVFARFGVVGPDADDHVIRITIKLSSFSFAPSSFDYEIKGGDHFIRGVSGGSGASETVIITGNVATAISVRAKSHSTPQNIIVTVS